MMDATAKQLCLDWTKFQLLRVPAVLHIKCCVCNEWMYQGQQFYDGDGSYVHKLCGERVSVKDSKP